MERSFSLFEIEGTYVRSQGLKKRQRKEQPASRGSTPTFEERAQRRAHLSSTWQPPWTNKRWSTLWEASQPATGVRMQQKSLYQKYKRMTVEVLADNVGPRCWQQQGSAVCVCILEFCTQGLLDHPCR